MKTLQLCFLLDRLPLLSNESLAVVLRSTSYDLKLFDTKPWRPRHSLFVCGADGRRNFHQSLSRSQKDHHSTIDSRDKLVAPNPEYGKEKTTRNKNNTHIHNNKNKRNRNDDLNGNDDDDNGNNKNKNMRFDSYGDFAFISNVALLVPWDGFRRTKQTVRAVYIHDRQLLPDDVFRKIFYGLIGKRPSFSHIHKCVEEANQWYIDNGYVLARIELIEKAIKEGKYLTFQAIEPKFKGVRIRYYYNKEDYEYEEQKTERGLDPEAGKKKKKSASEIVRDMSITSFSAQHFFNPKEKFEAEMAINEKHYENRANRRTAILLQRASGLKFGDYVKWSQADGEHFRTNLFKTQLFQTIHGHWVVKPFSNDAYMYVALTKSPKLVNMSPSIGADEGQIFGGFNLNDLNAFGGGEQVNVEWTQPFDRPFPDFQTTLRDPRWFQKPMFSNTINLQSQSHTRSSASVYRRNAVKLSFDWDRIQEKVGRHRFYTWTLDLAGEQIIPHESDLPLSQIIGGISAAFDNIRFVKPASENMNPSRCNFSYHSNLKNTFFSVYSPQFSNLTVTSEFVKYVRSKEFLKNCDFQRGPPLETLGDYPDREMEKSYPARLLVSKSGSVGSLYLEKTIPGLMPDCTSFWRLSTHATHFIPCWGNRISLAFNSQFRTASDTLPTFELFPLGGHATVRTYPFGTLGSNRILLSGKVELRTPIHDYVNAVLFMDSCTTFESENDAHYRTAGLGFRFANTFEAGIFWDFLGPERRPKFYSTMLNFQF